MDCFGTYFTHVQSSDVTRFKVLRNELLNLWCNSCSKCYGMDCFGTYFKIYTCPNLWWNRVQSATEWTASVHTLHMSKPVMQLVFKVLRNGLLNLWCNSCSSATEWTASVHTLKFTHVQTCDGTVFKVLRNGLLRYILCTCPNLWCNSFSKCYGMDCLTCDVTRVQSATEWTASVHT